MAPQKRLTFYFKGVWRGEITYLLVSASHLCSKKKSSPEVQVKLLAAGDSFTMAVTEVGGGRHFSWENTGNIGISGKEP